MNQEQARKFILAWNRVAYDVAPSRAESIADSEVMHALLAIANGTVVCELKPPPAPAASVKAAAAKIAAAKPDAG